MILATFLGIGGPKFGLPSKNLRKTNRGAQGGPKGSHGCRKTTQRGPKPSQRMAKGSLRAPQRPAWVPAWVQGPAWVTRNDRSLPYGIQFFHQSGPYESYGGLPTTIRRRISIRVFLDGSRVQLKQLLHHKLRKSRKL